MPGNNVASWSCSSGTIQYEFAVRVCVVLWLVEKNFFLPPQKTRHILMRFFFERVILPQAITLQESSLLLSC